MRVSRWSLTAATAIAAAAGNWGNAATLTIATVPGGLTVTVDGTNYAAPATFDWAPASPHTLDVPSPQVAVDGHSRSRFVAWTDGGGQSHSITAPVSDFSITASFVTQYLLETAVTPAGAGSITTNPRGPWCSAGQTVSLTATTNAGYRFYSWQGVDLAATNTAQVTMNGYHLVQAGFVPSDYPYLVVTNNGGAAPGDWIGNIDGNSADGTKLYNVILDNAGTNVLFASKTNTLYRFVTPQGLDAVADNLVFDLKDENLNVVESFGTLGYSVDFHDVKLLPNGHALLFGIEVRTIDMSQLVPGGKTAATVMGDVVQEIDPIKGIVFEWHTFEHIPITNSFYDLTQQSIDYAHMNAVALDPTDNNLLVSLRTTCEIAKISRQTGAVLWRLGGKANQFTFVGEHEENAPYYLVGQHDVHRLPNGNLLFFDNGNIFGGGITPNDRTYSRAVEYQLDESNKVAILVWEYRHTPDISASCTGSVKRFANGNTLIGWGCAVPTSGIIATEVSPAGNVVFEIAHHTAPGASSLVLGNGLTKQERDSPDLIRSDTLTNLAAGQTYGAPDAGVSVTVSGLAGSAENTLVVERHLDAVRFPQFAGPAPQVVMQHVILSASHIDSLQAELGLDLPDTSTDFDVPIIHDPAQVVIYHRPTPGQGQFSPLPTMYDGEMQKVRVTTTQTGEFIFAYPDLAETPYVPRIISPADQSQINQAEPVVLTWIPQGLVGSFDVQVSTNADFENLALDVKNWDFGPYVLQDLLPNTQYFWRVRVVNQGGTSDWASASFVTVLPGLHLTYPAGGEVWQRFQVVTIRWVGNIPGNVALDIYKGGVSNRTLVASAPNTGSYTWTVGLFQAFPPGSDYTLNIRSTADPAMYDFSPPFSMITNVTNLRIDGASLTCLPGGRVQFGISIPGALEATVMGSTNLLDWNVLQVVPLTNGSGVFTDDAAINFPQRFYRLRVP